MISKKQQKLLKEYATKGTEKLLKSLLGFDEDDTSKTFKEMLIENENR